MCAVSQIADYGRDNLFLDFTDVRVRREFQKLLDAAKIFDIAIKQPDCPSEEKEAWLTESGFYH